MDFRALATRWIDDQFRAQGGVIYHWVNEPVERGGEVVCTVRATLPRPAREGDGEVLRAFYGAEMPAMETADEMVCVHVRIHDYGAEFTPHEYEPGLGTLGPAIRESSLSLRALIRDYVETL